MFLKRIFQFRYLSIIFIGIVFDGHSVNALKCFKCNSTTVADCSMNPSADRLEFDECPSTDTECVTTVLDDSATYRGCKSDIEIPPDCKECLSSSCNSDFCNIEIFPVDRLRCYKCERQECVKVPDSPKPCRNYYKTDQCYVDVIDEADVIRGCYSDDDYDAGIYTHFCKTDGCNNQPAVTKFACLSCDSDIHDDCKHGEIWESGCRLDVIATCSIDVLYGRRESCYTYQNGNHVRRGCNRLDSDLVVDIQYVTTCTTQNCNNECYAMTSCHFCDSDDDMNCWEHQNSSLLDCPKQTDTCYACLQDLTVRRGCGTGGSNLGTCLTCSDPAGCNSAEAQLCYQCNSKTDPNCASWTFSDPPIVNECPAGCVSKIANDGRTQRDCLSDSFQCSADDQICQTCNQLGCNGGIFPKNRLQCYQCDETDDNCTVALSRLQSTPCLLYDAHDQCYQFLDDNGNMIRGCKSDARYAECEAQGNRCLRCDQSGCNNLDPWKQNSMDCAQCNNAVDCKWAQIYTPSCIAELPFYEEAGCYTFVGDNNWTSRGCIGDRDACDPIKEKNCQICRTRSCNVHNVVYQSCVQCSAKIDNGECARDAKGLVSTRCPNNIQYYDRIGCYVRRDNDLIIRGCISEINASVLKKCIKEDLCLTCLDQNCNYQSAPDKGSLRTGTALSLMAILAFSAMRLM